MQKVNFELFIMIWLQLEGKKFPAHQRTIAHFLQNAINDGEKQLLLMAFRASGKSTIVGLFCAWLLYQNPNCRILICSAEQNLATKMVRSVKGMFDKHPLLKPLKPHKLSQWAADEFTINRPEILRDPSMVARGIFGNITGFRADVIICDDVEVPNNCDTADKRAILRERLAEIDFILTPNGTQLYVGTPHCHDSLYNYSQNPAEPAFLQEFHRLYLPIINEHGKSSWPEKYPLPAIENYKKRHGLAKFLSQMMLESVPLSDNYFNPAQCQIYRDPLHYEQANGAQQYSIANQRIYSASCYWDPAFGGGDASVVAGVFTDGAGNYYIHDILYISTPNPQSPDNAQNQCHQVVDFLVRNYIPNIMVESNGLGKFLPALLRKIIHERGINAAVVAKNQTTQKNARITNALNAPLHAGAIWVHESVMRTKFYHELRDFNPNRTNNADDGLDAVANAILHEPIRLSTHTPTITRPVVGNHSVYNVK